MEQKLEMNLLNEKAKSETSELCDCPDCVDTDYCSLDDRCGECVGCLELIAEEQERDFEERKALGYR